MRKCFNCYWRVYAKEAKEFGEVLPRYEACSHPAHSGDTKIEPCNDHAFKQSGALPLKSDLVDLALFLHHRTDKAILVSDDGDWKKAVWLPLSQIEIEEGDKNNITVTCPEWLAKDKGLI